MTTGIRIHEPRKVPIGDLHEDPRNARAHPKRNREAVRSSLSEFGQVEALVVQKGTGRILGGNCRVGELRALGATEALVTELDLTDKQADRLALILNRSAETAEWDPDNLKDILADLQGDDLLEGLGWTDDELAALLDEPAGPGGGGDPGPTAPPEEPDSVLGAVYELGPHRLMCGSCTEVDSWDAVLQGEKPALVLTDPPYGLGDTTSEKNDYDHYDDTRENLVETIAGFLPLARGRAPVVVLSPGNGNTWLYPEPTWTIGWFTPAGVGRGPWGFCCWQPILCYGKDPKLAAGLGCHPDALAHTESAEDFGHPCSKPINFWVWLLDRCLANDGSEVVVDPFGGSGTTLIACAMTGRVARCIELDPRYCDVVRRRWTRWALDNGHDPGPGSLE